jgi:hypothetical protein
MWEADSATAQCSSALSGVTRDTDYYARYKNITARTGMEVLAIDREKHTLSCRDVKSGKPKPSL